MSSIAGTQLIAASGTYDIKPASGSGIEWDIHNVYYNNPATLSMTDGINVVDFSVSTAQGSKMGVTFHVSSRYWLRITNTGTTDLLIAYDGAQS